MTLKSTDKQRTDTMQMFMKITLDLSTLRKIKE